MEFIINIVDDSIPETVEEFSVALVPVNYAVGERSEALVYIQDDDGEWKEGRVVFESCPLVTSVQYNQINGSTHTSRSLPPHFMFSPTTLHLLSYHTSRSLPPHLK